MSNTPNVKVKVENLSVSFRTTQGFVRAVRDVSFDLHEKETLAIVGESGSGKSVTSRAIMGILAGNAVVDEGKIVYQGQDLLKIPEHTFHTIRGDKIGMIFQDPMSSLNPIMRIGKQITEGILINGDHRKRHYNNLIRQSYNDVYDAKQLIKSERASYKAQLKELKENEKAEEITKLKSSQKEQEKQRKGELAEKRQKLRKDKAKAKKEVKEHFGSLRAEKTEEINKFKETQGPKAKEAYPQYKEKYDKAKQAYRDEISKLKEKQQSELARFEKDNANLKQNQKTRYARLLKEKRNEFKKSLKETHQKHRAILADIKNPVKEYKRKLSYLKNQRKRVIKVTKEEAKERAIEVMKEVGIPDPEKRFRQYPFQFSGGMRQRIVIAITLTANPEILICDEPTTALDVTIQSQILELINKLKEQHNLSIIFITHDLGVVASMADRVAVMYAGKIVEIGQVNEIFYEPKHPYTWALLSSMPDLHSQDRLMAIPGTPPNMLFPPKGDAFADRNSYAMKIDFEKQPPFFKVSETHYAATWLLHKDAPKVELPKEIQRRIQNMHGVENKKEAKS